MNKRQIMLTVHGRPAQMGSKTAVVRGGRAIVIDANAKNKLQWANAVSTRAAEVMNGSPRLAGPLHLEVIFFFKRPKGHYGSGKNAGILKATAPDRHTQAPDCDKLLRNLMDALSTAVFIDDSQVCRITAYRRWADDCGERAEIIVTEL
jgi:Holliday junction resolvase RusA-like endonuclease